MQAVRKRVAASRRCNGLGLRAAIPAERQEHSAIGVAFLTGYGIACALKETSDQGDRACDNDDTDNHRANTGTRLCDFNSLNLLGGDYLPGNH